ncbi:hypothetical protein B4U80_13551 [Leptotrombidium deliense]|uniref:F-box domain-containing protein n=1 Tax=Leptotrombidium deliense TaxID=299467 RepID=A0A443S4U0_9ACAR|nr:hypothetical protein B4U80_13551 [Leptotrombidium deliense]
MSVESESFQLGNNVENEIETKFESLEAEIMYLRQQNCYLKAKNKEFKRRLDLIHSSKGRKIESFTQTDGLLYGEEKNIFCLNVDLFNEIFSHLSMAELHSLRVVSKQMKYFVEIYFKSVTVLPIVMEQLTAETIQYLYTSFPRINSLTIETRVDKDTDLSFECFIFSLKNKFNNLKQLKLIDGSRKISDLRLLGNCFCEIKHLYLRTPQITDASLVVALPKFRNLQKLTICDTPIFGYCFRYIGSELNKINWDICETAENFEELSFARETNNIQSLTLKGEISTQAFAVISREMPKLQKLKMLFDEIYDFENLNLETLEELNISSFILAENIILQNRIVSLKKLCLDIHNLNDAQLVSVLSNFPNLVYLKLTFTENTVIIFSDIVVTAFKQLKSLKKFTLMDEAFESNKYIGSLNDNGLTVGLVAAVQNIENITELCLYLNFEDNDTFCFSLLCDIESIAENHSNAEFKLHFWNLPEIIFSFPPNMKVFSLPSTDYE